MIFYLIFLFNPLDGKLTSDFKFPDPIRDRETPFCPIDPLLTTNAEVRCTNSAFRTEFNEYTVTRLNSEKFQNLSFKPKTAIFEEKSQK